MTTETHEVFVVEDLKDPGWYLAPTGAQEWGPSVLPRKGIANAIKSLTYKDAVKVLEDYAGGPWYDEGGYNAFGRLRRGKWYPPSWKGQNQYSIVKVRIVITTQITVLETHVL